ncbi:MAG: HflC protein [Rickettsiales bacterium]|nr:HflC protein [Rickettsiales bacterium]
MVRIVTPFLLLVGFFLVSSVFYIVEETDQVIITQFGKPVGEPISEPGLRFKVPFVQKVNRFEKRFLEWDGYPNQVPTRDKRFIWVDTTARWRVSEPLLFFQRLRDERGAQSRLDDILDGATRNAIANHDLIDLVRTTASEEEQRGAVDAAKDAAAKTWAGRDTLSTEVQKSAAAAATDLGIEILDFRFKRINYQEDVRKEVYTRMISERKRIAEEYRSEGQGEAARINGERERQLKVITSEAYREAKEVTGNADAKAADIYAAAYNKGPEFYAFLKSMELYPETIEGGSRLVLSTDSDFLRYLGESK